MGFLSKLFGGKTPKQQVTPSKASPEPDSSEDLEGESVPQELAEPEARELHARAGAACFLDVREHHELKSEGWIPGSIHIPMAELPMRLGELDKAKPTIVYCARGGRSMDAGFLLLEKGFRSVSNLNGGIQSWKGPKERQT